MVKIDTEIVRIHPPCDWGEFGQIGITDLIKSEKMKFAQANGVPNFTRLKFSFLKILGQLHVQKRGYNGFDEGRPKNSLYVRYYKPEIT